MIAVNPAVIHRPARRLLAKASSVQASSNQHNNSKDACNLLQDFLIFSMGGIG
jgi:hypothetical protein